MFNIVRHAVIVNGCIAALIVQNSPVHAGTKVLPRAEAAQLLLEISESWDQMYHAVNCVTGKVKLQQSTLMTSFLVPVEPSPVNNDDSRPPFGKSEIVENTPISGEFLQREFAVVAFKTDRIHGRHWCHWLSVEPTAVINVHTGDQVWKTTVPTESVSILTADDFFHRPVGGRLSSIAGSSLPADLIKLDILQNRHTPGGFRGIVFRAGPERGPAFKERSFLFDSSSLLTIGGQLPHEFLASVAVFLRNGDDVRVSAALDASGGITDITIRVPYQPNIIVESTWKCDESSSMRSFFPDTVTLAIGSQADGNQVAGATDGNHYTTTWKWDSARFKNGSLAPLEWEFLVRSSPTSEPNFRRLVESVEFVEASEISDAAFEPSSLDIQTGDLIYDRDAKTVGYVAADKTVIALSNVDNPSLSNTLNTAVWRKWSLDSRVLVVNGTILGVFVAVYLYRKRTSSKDSPRTDK